VLEAEVVAELGRIRTTLSSFAAKYALGQKHLRTAHALQLPLALQDTGSAALLSL
jgi:hypothetical protein